MNKVILGVSIFAIGISFSNAEVVKGYTLPPEPNKALNHSTLLGIDSNNNMLRDDVERWVVKQPWSHQRIAGALQRMRGLQILINEDIGDENIRSAFGSMTERAYFASRHNPSLTEQLREEDEFAARMFNTKERKKAYLDYDASFSGKIIHAFPGSGKFSYKYADYTMEDGNLGSYEFNPDIYSSKELIPLYSGENGTIGAYWSLEKNNVVKFEGNWNDKYCEVNFGVSKGGKECWEAEQLYIKDLKRQGIIKQKI